jgi:hypothetical protein
MSKTYGLKTEFSPIRKDRSRLVVSYERVPEQDGIHATWYEIYFYKKQHPTVTFEEIKEAILSDINAQTDAKILTGFVWNDKPVWLSRENQFNFKAAYDLAVQTKGKSLPVKFKLGELEDEAPVYHTFEDLSEIADFYTKAMVYINQCLNEGWNRKDSIDWSQYGEDKKKEDEGDGSNEGKGGENNGGGIE